LVVFCFHFNGFDGAILTAHSAALLLKSLQFCARMWHCTELGGGFSGADNGQQRLPRSDGAAENGCHQSLLGNVRHHGNSVQRCTNH